MSEPNRTAPAATVKPEKPYPDFPLFPHATRRWAKKIRGQLHYFGPWSDPDGALRRYNEQKDDLHAGRKPRPDAQAVTVRDVCNAFLTHKDDLRNAGELSPRTYAQYKETTDLLVERFGLLRLVSDLGPDDFAALRRHLAKRWQPGTLGNFSQRVRVVFKFAADNDLIDRPLRYGQGFKRPTKKTLRVERARQGPKLFTPEDVRKLLDGPSVQLRAMMLLGINCGLGNADCGRLKTQALDLERGWLDYPREKTGMPRRCRLWPETVQALKDALARRREPKNPADADLVFITRTGQSWHTDTTESPIAYEVGKLLRRLGINGRKGLGFYTLRHTFRTIADEAKDQPAADYIMGHEVAHMSSVYRESISDERLKAVTDHVRAWLYSAQPARPPLGSAPEAAERVDGPAALGDDSSSGTAG